MSITHIVGDNDGYQLDGFSNTILYFEENISVSQGDITILDRNLYVTQQGSFSGKYYKKVGFSSINKSSIGDFGARAITFWGTDAVVADYSISRNSQIEKRNGFSDTITSSFIVTYNVVRSVDWNTTLYVTDGGFKNVYQYDGFSSTITDSVSTSGLSSNTLRGMTVNKDDNNLYVTQGSIYKLDGFSNTQLDSFVPPVTAKGIYITSDYLSEVNTKATIVGTGNILVY